MRIDRKLRPIALPAILFILTALAVSAQLVAYGSARPDIVLEFNEPVCLIEAKLSREFREYNASYALNASPVQGAGCSNATEPASTTITLTPVRPLMNGNYSLFVRARDVVLNEVNFSTNITIDVAYIGIRLSNPPLSVSPVQVFDLNISTSEAADCKFAFLDIGYDSAIFTMNQSNDNLSHSWLGFNKPGSPTAYLPVPEQERPLFVYCRQHGGASPGRINSALFWISWDPSPPIISAAAQPRVVVERRDGAIYSDIVIDSDDKVVCALSGLNATENRSYGPNSTNAAEILAPIGLLPEELYNSTQSLRAEMTEAVSGAPLDYWKFSYAVACRNRANLTSDIAIVPVDVNLLAPVEITKLSPPDAARETAVRLEFVTSKKASCTYVLDGTSGTFDQTAPATRHTKELGTFAEGRYSITVECTAAEGTASRSFAFVIDLTPPAAPTVLAPTAICAHSLPVTVVGNDTLSGIAGFNLSLRGTFGPIAGPIWVSATDSSASTSFERDAQGVPINWSETSVYTVEAVARDKAGHWSGSGLSNGTLYDSSGVACDTIAPLIFVRQNVTTTGTIVSLLCVDRESACDNSSYAYLLAPDANCSGLFSPLVFDPELGWAVRAYEPGYFCYEAADLARNSARGAEVLTIAIAPSCENGAVDGGESDIDCGGETSCPRCELGQACTADSDCVSNYCDQASLNCTTPSCEDGIKNGLESSADCGGPICMPCGTNASCARNADCASNACHPEQKICVEPACDDGFVGGNETDIDCGGPCAPCGDGASCAVDADCLSGYCWSRKCMAKPVEERPLPPRAALPLAKLSLVGVGLASLLSGVGYLSWLRFVPKPKAPPRAPAAPPTPPPAPPRPTLREEIARAIALQRRRLEEARRARERAKLLGIFAPPKAAPPARAPPAPPARPPARPPPPPPKKVEEFERLAELAERKEKEVAEKLEKLARRRPRRR